MSCFLLLSLSTGFFAQNALGLINYLDVFKSEILNLTLKVQLLLKPCLLKNSFPVLVILSPNIIWKYHVAIGVFADPLPNHVKHACAYRFK